MKAKLFLVEWFDACSQDAWVDLSSQQLEPPLIFSVGFLVKKTKKYITLAPNIDSDLLSAACCITIPTGMVKRMIPIKPRG